MSVCGFPVGIEPTSSQLAPGPPELKTGDGGAVGAKAGIGWSKYDLSHADFSPCPADAVPGKAITKANAATNTSLRDMKDNSPAVDVGFCNASDTRILRWAIPKLT